MADPSPQRYNSPMPSPAIAFASPGHYAAARELLNRHAFTRAGILQRLNAQSIPSLKESDTPLLLWYTREASPLDTLIRLFIMNIPVDAAQVRRALEPITSEDWLSAGLLRRAGAAGDSLSAAVKLMPYNDQFFAFDLNPRVEADIRSDYVMGIGAATISLQNLTTRRPSDLTLDLGTGCGTQAHFCSPHSGQVIATDTNPRALDFCRFNTALNAVSNIEPRAGSLFEPVSDQAGRFNLIVTNPPFVISPESRYMFRDSGMRGDEICRTIVQQGPKYLAEGGLLQMLCNWAHTDDEPWQQHLASWVQGSGCDAWILRSDTHDAATYANTWLQQTDKHLLQRDSSLFDQWMDYYKKSGIVAVSAGCITLRRRTPSSAPGNTAPNFLRIDDSPSTFVGPIGTDIARGLELRAFLDSHADDNALLDTAFTASSDTRLEQQAKPADGSWQILEYTLHRAIGLAPRGRCDPYIAMLVARSNGRTPLRELVATVASDLSQPFDSIAQPLVGMVRELIAQGFLLPPGIV
jgi:methylase of polypeptide subunit release factors